MTRLPSRKHILHSLRLAIVIAFIFSAVGNSVLADTAVTDSSTPSALTPGSPVGSYSLTGFDNINLFNGHLDFHLPLIGIGGRGTAGYRMMLPVEQKWLVKEYRLSQAGALVRYADPNWWSGLNVGLGPGVMQARYSGTGRYSCEPDADGSPNWRFYYTHTRLTFTGADGTEYELRDQLTGGQPSDRFSTAYCGGGFSRGTVFVSADGSNALFTADSPIIDPTYTDIADPGGVSGYLVLRDGTRYRFDGGYTTWIQDRNGNRTTFTYGQQTSFGNQVTAITDSIGRQITIDYHATDDSYGAGTRITFKGTGAAVRNIFLTEGPLEGHLRPDYLQQAKTYQQLFPELSGTISNTPFNPKVVHSVWLPDGERYQLFYNPYGEIARVVLPTGGAIEYDYTGGLTNGNPDGVADFGTYGGTGSANYQIYRRVVERRTYRNQSDTTPESTMTVSRPESMGANTTVQSAGYVEVDQHAGNSAGSLLSRTRHYYYGSAAASLRNSPGGYSRWSEGREYKTEVMAEDGATVLRRVENTWQQRAPVSWWSWWVSKYPASLSEEPPNDPRMVEAVTTLEPSGANKVSKQTSLDPNNNNTVGFDQYNNQTDVWEYDYGVGQPGDLRRHTHTDYLTINSANGIDYTSSGVHILNLERAQQIYAKNSQNLPESLVAQSEVRYDEPDYPLLAYGIIVGWSTPATNARGLATTGRRWLDTQNTWLETHAQYDLTGNLRNSWDFKGNQSSITYDDSFSDNTSRFAYAFPTHTVSAVPDPTGAQGSSTSLEMWSKYDYWSGVQTSATDANNKTTTFEHNDDLDRLTKVNSPDGGWTSYGYGQNAYGDYLHTQVLQNSSGLTSDRYDYFDGLGRLSRSFQYHNSDPNLPWLTTDTQYDALGRVWKQSNPYYAVGLIGSINPSGNWTTTLYDALGRVKSVTTPDNAVINTSYSGNSLTVTDQTSRSRQSWTDALGRLTQMIEDPGGTGHLNYQTDYTYDALGNLRQVTQGAQNRYFLYDSLSRLIRAKNPEQAANPNLSAMLDPITQNSQWSMAYSYDNNGNLTQKTDPRNITTSYTYDALNRNTTTDYSDTSTNPDSRRYYDGAVLGKGRLWQTVTFTPTNRNSYTAIDAYDAMGRILSERQQFYYYNAASQSYLWGQNYTTQRSYDLAGHVSTQVYPSVHAVSYAYDVAGRTQNFSGSLGDGAQRSYSSNISYNEWGMRQEQLGTQMTVYNKHFYNVRGQLAEIRESTTANDTSWNRGAIINHYSGNCWGMCSVNPTAATDDNGNLKKQDHWIPRDDAISAYDVYTDFFEYDSLNRLQSARETLNGGAVNWKQSYIYDQWGNRTIDPNLANTFGTGIPHPELNVNSATNQLTVPAGKSGVMQYDAAGNLSNDTYTSYGQRTFDAENRMLTAADNLGGTSSYAYDAEGRRVRRISNNAEVWQVYGIDGELLAEYAANAAPGSPQKEYGYRNAELLITATAPASSSSSSNTQNVSWTNAVGVNPSANNLTKTAASAWGNAGASSIQSIISGNGSVEFTATETNDSRMCGLSAGDSDQNWQDIDYAIYLGDNGIIYIYEAGTYQGGYGAYAAGDRFKVAVEAGAVKYYRNSTLLYRSSAPPAYPLVVDTALRDTGATLTNVVMTGIGAGSSGGTGGDIEWMVTDQLGTARMVLDQSGSLSGVKRHDYLPFGEELYAGAGLRTTQMGYASDGLRQKFTGYERDSETGLDYAAARYYANNQGRFASPDPLLASARSSNPQSWNRYTYVLNKPLQMIDSSGLMPDASQSSDNEEEERDNYNANGEAAYDNRLHHQYNAQAATKAASDGDWDTFIDLLSRDDSLQVQDSELVEGPFVFPEVAAHPEQYMDRKYVTGQCATFVQRIADKLGKPLGRANDRKHGGQYWKMGRAVMDTPDIEPGTVIGSGFNENGEYPNNNAFNHVGFFLRWIPNGFEMLEEIHGRIQTRPVLKVGKTGGNYFRDPYMYNIIMVALPIKSGVGGGRRSP